MNALIVRAPWIVTAALLAGGAYLIETKYERAIDASRASVEVLYHRTVANRRIVEHAESLRAEQNAAESDLQSVSRESSLSRSMANLLATLQDSAARYHSQILAVDPGRTAAVSEGMLATDVTVRIHGAFGDIVRFSEDLSRNAQPVKVSHTELAVSVDPDPMKAPKTDASVHATLYRIISARGDGENDAFHS